MGISIEVVRGIARLARLRLSDEEAERYRAQLGKVLDHVADLSRLDVSSVPGTCALGAGALGAGASGLAPGLNNVVREDAPKPFPGREDILANAPRREGSYFKVRKVL